MNRSPVDFSDIEVVREIALSKDGNLTRKQNVFDGFTACARHLIGSGYTSSTKLAVEGRSYGGLPMGAFLTMLPRHHIARERLCLRTTTDNRVNGIDGLPFCEINQAVVGTIRLVHPAWRKLVKLATRSKHFIDTHKITAYRAETALAQVMREQLNTHHQDEARALIRDICPLPQTPPPEP